MQPIYFDIAGVPGKYFECKRYGKMSTEACGKNFTAAPRAFRLAGRLEGCVGCPVGKSHAASAAEAEGPRSRCLQGVFPVGGTPVEAVYYRPVCLRCRRDGKEEGSRLISRLRLVRQQTICVSCFNREREVMRGANAKGAKPKKWALFRPRVAYVRDSRVMREAMATPVVDRIEVALTLLRKPGAVGVMWAAAPIVRLA